MPIVKRMKPGQATVDPPGNGSVSHAESRIFFPEINNPPNDLLAYTLMCYGQKGVGKTSLFACIPNVVVAMAEVGRHNLRIRQFPEVGAPDLDYRTLLQYNKLFFGMPDAKRPKVIVLDTIDRIYDQLLQYVREEAGYKTLDQFQWGDWETITRYLNELVSSYRAHNMSPVFLSHAKQRELEVETEVGSGALSLTAPTCKPMCWKFLKMVVDVAMYYGYIQYRRAIFFSGSEHLWCANGLPEHFLDAKTGDPLTAIYTGRNAEETWKRLQQAFNNQLTSDWSPVTESLSPAEELPEHPVATNTVVTKLRKKKS